MTSPGTAAGEAEGTPPPPDKRALRRHFRSLRAAALADAQPRILAAARRDLPHLLKAGQSLGVYWPVAGEADLRPLALEHPCLALPAVAGEPPRLLYRLWRPGAPLAPDRCGIPAPLPPGGSRTNDGHAQLLPDVPDPEPELPPHALGLLLVPALAFDPASGVRLGYGGGWYDRLRADPAWRAVPALAVLPAAGLCPGLPRDPWDVPFQGWLDEQGVHRSDPPAAGDAEEGDPASARL
jgi:5-formyltetrahydrofolate cyclo-ligase